MISLLSVFSKIRGSILIRKQENLFEIPHLREKFNRPDEGLGILDRQMVDIPEIKFSRNADIG